MDSDLSVIFKNVSFKSVEGNPSPLSKSVAELYGEDAIVSFNVNKSDSSESCSVVLTLKRKEDGL
jgi:hypothetical protein